MSKSSFKNRMISFSAVISLLAGMIVAEIYLKNTQRAYVLHNLQSLLASTHSALIAWHQEQLTAVSQIASMPKVEVLSSRLAAGPRSRLELSASPDHVELKGLLSHWLNQHDFVQYHLMSEDGVIISSSQETRVGQTFIVSRNQPDLFSAVISGESRITKPMVIIEQDQNRERSKKAYLFAMTPVYYADGDSIMVLAVQIPATGSYLSLFLIGRSGQSGETYAFDDKGRFLSESRFRERIIMDEELNPNDTTILNVNVRDPSNGLPISDGTIDDQFPLTFMAASAISGISSHNVAGYNDYRGVPVVGAWLWDRQLGMGLTTEIDRDEAFYLIDYSLIVIRVFGVVAIFAMLWVIINQRLYSRRFASQKADLLQARDTAEMANHSKSVFLSSMSHELRTPLNAVIGFGQLMLKNRIIRSNGELKEQTEYVVQNGEHLLDLLNEVLDFAKLDVGELSFNYRTKHPASLIEESRIMIDSAARKKQINIVLENDMTTLPAVFVDVTRTKQVLANLLANAVKYNRELGQIFISVEHDQSVVRFNIRDTGRGISSDQMEHLWEPFNRLGAENTEVEGSGIGLAISKKIVEAMGGNIGASSVPGVGSTFWFTVAAGSGDAPISEESSMFLDDDSDQLAEPLVKRKISILCVEDMVLNQKIIDKMLDQYYDHTTIFCTTGLDSLDILADPDRHFDVILLDLNLPDMTGFDFQRTMEARYPHRKIPIIAVTADVSYKTQRKVEASGIQEFVPKPVKLRALKVAIDAVTLDTKDE